MLNTGGSHFLIQRKSDMNALFTKKGKAGLLQLRWCDIPTTLQLIACMHAQSVSCVRLFATPWTVALQAPLSMEFCRQEY